MDSRLQAGCYTRPCDRSRPCHLVQKPLAYTSRQALKRRTHSCSKESQARALLCVQGRSSTGVRQAVRSWLPGSAHLAPREQETKTNYVHEVAAWMLQFQHSG